MTRLAVPLELPGTDPRAETAAEVRAALAQRRALTVASLDAAERDFRRLVESARSVSTDDEHDPDGPGLAVERALIVAFRAQARGRLEALDRALERLGSGRYGRCEACGGEIGADRLAARPGASTCIDCARAASRRR